jgi:predicted CopG family antitoxin
MRRKLTITVDEEVYEGLRRVVGPRHISRFLETLARPHVVLADVDAAYAAMAADEDREEDALQWAEATVGDVAGSEGDWDETR